MQVFVSVILLWIGIVGVKDLNQYEIKRMIAEVKLIKAYMHFYLLTYYGPICPLRENIPAVNESTQGVTGIS